jgi:spermidine synthase
MKIIMDQEELRVILIVTLAGFVTLELEVLGTRLISPIFGPTIYVWSSMIGVTLALLAIGYRLGGRIADKGKISITLLGILILLAGIYIASLPWISNLILYHFSNLGIMLGPLISSLLIFLFPMLSLGFIVPASVKIVTSSLDELGRKVGDIYFAGTLGSIAGAIVTGYFLIFYLGIKETCLATGIVLILASLLIIKPKEKFLFLLAIPILLSLPKMHLPGILESIDSFYGQIRVIEKDGFLTLYMDGIAQTHVWSETKEDAGNYGFFFQIPLVYNPGIKKVLMIGLAGGVVARDLARSYRVSLDVVDIEPRTLGIARNYFGWSNEARVYFDDGRHFIRSSGKYDLIILDIGYIFYAWHLYTLEAFREIYDHLGEEGMLMISMGGAKEGKYSKGPTSLYKTLLQAGFEDVLIFKHPFPKPYHVQAIILLASKERIDRAKLLKLAKEANLSYARGSLVEVVEEALEGFNVTQDVVLHRDNHPIAELYDYEVFERFSRYTKEFLLYLLPG